MNQTPLNFEMNSMINELVRIVSGHFITDGIHETKIPSLHIIRASDVSEPLPVIYEPALLVIIQGAKRVTLGSEAFVYDPTAYLVTAAQLPVSSQIILANREKPYLCIRISIQLEQLLSIMSEIGKYPYRQRKSESGLVILKTNRELLDAVLRLIKLMETEEDIKVLSPLIMREILYRILKDDCGTIGQFLNIGSHSKHVLKVIDWINHEFSSPLDINALAEKMNMSTSGLYKHFKNVTHLSPLQYQKMVRLQEARRLLLEEKMEAATVSYQVGYESPSQFSREYARLFGMPPISDVKRFKDKSLGSQRGMD